ncbi:MAG: RNase adapter RapZ [Thermoanaerobaculaceae bacterium]|nr:RNase adapter RapZ [Thermoanaerobaculaceae bacterium]
MKKTILIVTGMSGAGKTQVINTLQDNGFFCIDNLPLALFSKFLELLATPSGELGSFVALGLDLREGNLDEKFPEVLELLQKSGHTTKIIFVDASDDVLLRRFVETRRPHPLSPKGSVQEGISTERRRMEFIREKSDYLIDTSHFNIHQLREEVLRHLETLSLEARMVVNIVSFGFSKGMPPEASLIFDVRFLPNPYFVPDLKDLDGRDSKVSNFVLQSEEGKLFLEKLKDFLDFLLPRFQKEGKAYLTIGIGCTGGRHRSVAIAKEIYNYLKEKNLYDVNLRHNEIEE